PLGAAAPQSPALPFTPTASGGVLWLFPIDVASMALLQPQAFANFEEAPGILIASSMSVPMLVFMAILGVRTVKHALLYRELKDQGVTTQGHVVDRWGVWFTISRPRRFWRYIAYEYTDGYTAYAAKQMIPIGLYKHTQVGTPVTVRYLPHDPSISQVELVDDKKVP
ncbi:MAG: hypothetical protein JW918_01590, partial [Anaerolineae bacterium]|nr:hypothetical protein [Anaerolineae bacterium]